MNDQVLNRYFQKMTATAVSPVVHMISDISQLELGKCILAARVDNKSRIRASVRSNVIVGGS